MEKVKFRDITINMDNRRKPLNSSDREKISEKKLYPYCGANDIMDYVDEYLFDEEILCIAEDGGKWGKNEECSYIMRGKCWVNNHAHVIKATDKVDLRYLKYWLNYNDLNSQITGAIVRKLTQKALNELEIILPEKDKQVYICNTFDKIQEINYFKRKQIEELEELIKSQFFEMFGSIKENKFNYKKVKFADICSNIGDGLHGTPKYDENGKYPFINGNNFIDNKITITKATKFVNEEQFKQYYIPLTDNTIFLSINGTLGKTAFYNNEQIILGKSACYFNLKENINKNYIYGLMNTDEFLEFLENSSTKSTIKNVGLKALREYFVILPPIELQNQFAQTVKLIDKQKFEIQKSLQEVQNLQESLMNKYFGG